MGTIIGIVFTASLSILIGVATWLVFRDRIRWYHAAAIMVLISFIAIAVAWELSVNQYARSRTVSFASLLLTSSLRIWRCKQTSDIIWAFSIQVALMAGVGMAAWIPVRFRK